jgi:hypothetical protein
VIWIFPNTLLLLMDHLLLFDEFENRVTHVQAKSAVLVVSFVLPVGDKLAELFKELLSLLSAVEITPNKAGQNSI